MPDAETKLVPAPVPDLPSGKIAHANTFRNELEQRRFGFETGIAALQQELDGQEQEFNTARAKAEEEHAMRRADLLRRIDDMRTGETMALAAIDVWDRTQAQGGEPAPSTPPPKPAAD